MTAAFVRRPRRLVAMVATPALTLVLAAGCVAAVNGSAQPDPNATATTATLSTTSTAGTGRPGAPTSRPNRPVSTMLRPSPSSDAADSAQPGSAQPSSAEPSDTAAYPTAPVPLPAHASTPSGGALLESARLGAYVVDPSAIEPQYVDPVDVVTAPIDVASKLGRAFVAPVPAVAARDQVYAGFIAARGIGTGKPGSLIMVVLELPTAADAKKPVTDLSAADNSNHTKLSEFPGQPAAIGWVGPSGAGENAQAFLAVRSMVVYVYALGAVSAKSTLPALVSMALGKQVAALQDFTPTPKDKLGELPTDPAGIYARVLPVSGPRPLDTATSPRRPCCTS